MTDRNEGRNARDTDDRQEELVVHDKRRFTSDGDRRTDVEEELQDAEEALEQALGDAKEVSSKELEQLALRAEAAERRAAEAEQRLTEYVAAFQRVKEEQEKTFARFERDKDKRVRETLATTFAGILDALDNLERALDHAPGDDPVAEGVRLVHKQLLALLERQGLERLEVVGQPFDPEHSEAVLVTPVEDDSEHDVVLEELRPGYRFRDTILRPAQVRVGRKS